MIDSGVVIGGRYRLQVRLGDPSGAGAVWQADDLEAGDKAAVAMIDVEDDALRDLADRFLDHARRAEALRGEGLVPIRQVGTYDRVCFAAMDFLEGYNLAARLTSQPPLTVGHIVEYGAMALEALIVLHEAGIVHGDVEPGNLFVMPQYTPERGVLTGIGLSRALAREGKLARRYRDSDAGFLRVLAYASPEQASSADVDFRADLYSVGAMVYAGLTGKLPVEVQTEDAMRRAITESSVPTLLEVRPELGEGLSKVLEQAMTKEPAGRWSDARLMRSKLLRALVKSDGIAELPVPRLAHRSASIPPGARRERAWSYRPPSPAKFALDAEANVEPSRSTVQGSERPEPPAIHSAAIPKNEPSPGTHRGAEPEIFATSRTPEPIPDAPSAAAPRTKPHASPALADVASTASDAPIDVPPPEPRESNDRAAADTSNGTVRAPSADVPLAAVNLAAVKSNAPAPRPSRTVFVLTATNIATALALLVVAWPRWTPQNTSSKPASTAAIARATAPRTVPPSPPPASPQLPEAPPSAPDETASVVTRSEGALEAAATQPPPQQTIQIRMEGLPRGASIRVDGVRMPGAEFAVPRDRKKHWIFVWHPKHVLWREHVAFDEDKAIEVEMVPLPP